MPPAPVMHVGELLLCRLHPAGLDRVDEGRLRVVSWSMVGSSKDEGYFISPNRWRNKQNANAPEAVGGHKKTHQVRLVLGREEKDRRVDDGRVVDGEERRVRGGGGGVGGGVLCFIVCGGGGGTMTRTQSSQR